MQKNQSSSAGKKKKKKSKAELEAERLEKERVEAEVEAERERVLEEERKKAEAKAEELRQDLKAKRKNEVQLLVTEYEDEIASYEENQARLKELTSKADKEKDWERFISCSTLPFVQSVPEINTYLSEQYESLLLEEDDTSIVTRLLSWIATNQYICQALLAHSAESATKSEEKNNLVCALYDASNAQIDKACSYVIQHADNSYARDESSKPNHSAKSEFFFQTRDLDAFCHLPSKGKNDGFLSTKDDKRDNTIMQHPSSSMIKSNQRKTQIRTQTTSDSDALTSSSPMSTPGKGGKRTPSKYFNSSHMFSSTLHGATEQNFNTNENTLSIFRVDTDTIPEGAPRNNFEKAIRGEIRIGVWANLVARSVRGPFKQLSFTDIDLGLDLPKSLGTQRIGARIVFFPYEHIPKIYRSLSPLNNLDRKLEPFEDDDEFDAALLPSERMLILATIQIEIFELPRKPVQLRPKLMFRQLTSAEQQGTVKLIHFPPGAEIGKDRIPLVAAAPSLNQFLRAKLKPPKNLFIPKDLRVAWFDARRGRWIDGTASKIEYNFAKREIGFNFTRSGILALVQCRTTDLPYTQWSLRVSAKATCVLNLVTPRFNLDIQVCENMVQLIHPQDVPELNHLLNQPLSPVALLSALRAVGVHLRPTDADARSINLIPKNAALETKLANDIAELAASFDFKPHINALDSDHRYALSITETTAFMQILSNNIANATFQCTFDSFCALIQTDQASPSYKHDEESQSHFPSHFCKCGLVIGSTTSSSSFDDNLLDGCSSHVSLRRALEPVSSKIAMQRSSESSPLFKATVAQLLILTRPFSFLVAAPHHPK